LEDLFVKEGWRLLAETGLAQFSAREVAKRAGYSIGSVYNVFGSYDGLVLAINARTLALWAQHLRSRLAEGGQDPIEILVRGYFEFAHANPWTWRAVYEHHLAGNGPAPDWYQAVVADLMGIVVGQIATALPGSAPAAVEALSRSLVATVHGHCVFSVFRTFDLLGETDPAGAALARVREALAAAVLNAAGYPGQRL
jgi:AcrR family transcriptional regulator